MTRGGKQPEKFFNAIGQTVDPVRQDIEGVFWCLYFEVVEGERKYNLAKIEIHQ